MKLLEKYDRLVYFDTETTGFDAEKEQMIELAAVCVEKGTEGDKRMDEFIQIYRVPELPTKITELTGILPITLAMQGIPAEDAVGLFVHLFGTGEKTLLIAHNAQFDINFLGIELVREMDSHMERLQAFNRCDYLDTLTVYKDRTCYPHKLADAINHYGLGDKVQNSHRAIDDTLALKAVTEAMEAEREDLTEYINLFGYNPRYGISGRKFKKVRYAKQETAFYARKPEDILPRAIAGAVT